MRKDNINFRAELHSYDPDDGPLSTSELAEIEARAKEKLPTGRPLGTKRLFSFLSSKPDKIRSDS